MTLRHGSAFNVRAMLRAAIFVALFVTASLTLASGLGARAVGRIDLLYGWFGGIGAQNQNRVVTTVSAASFEPSAPVAPESIAAIFGVDLATDVRIVNTLPLPNELLGTSVAVRDSAGTERFAFLFFISPTQINCLIPAGTAEGLATITVRSGRGNTETGTVLVSKAAPSILTANASGVGAPAAVALRIRSNGSFGFEGILQGGYPNIAPAAIDLGPEGESVFLVLYLCGLRFVPKADVRVLLGGGEVPPEDFAYSPSDFIGVDQLNVRLSRSLIGRGRLKLSVSAQGRVSNQIEVEIGGRIVSEAPQITAVSKTADLLAGEEIVLTGARFAATAKDNAVRFGTRPATVMSASSGQLRIRVPYGAESDQVTVITPQGEGRSSQTLTMRTTISGFVKDTHNSPIPGVKITMGNNTVQTNSEGLFFISEVPANTGTVFLQFDGRAVTGALFPDPPIKYRISANRDNLVDTPVFLLQVNGAQTQIGSALTGSPETEEEVTLTTAAPDQTGAGDLKFTVPAGTTIRFPNGATSGTLTLNAEPNGLTPIALPPDNFVSVIAQLAFFGATLNPGGKLIFPNPESLPPGTVARLYQYDVGVGSPTRGEWVDTKDAVTVFADRIETSANAIKQSTYYFVAAQRPVTTAIGRVIEDNGTPDGRPVAGATVRIRGRETTTDGNGGFVLRNVGVNGDGRIFADVNLLRANGQVDSKQSPSVQATLNGLTNLGTIVLSADAVPNRPPVALIPASITVNAGEEFDLPFTASDPDPGQSVSLQISDARLAEIIPRGNGAYTLRLKPTLSDANSVFKLLLTVTDNLGKSQGFDIAVAVRGNLLAIPQSVTTNEDQPVSLRLSGSDPADRPLTYQIISQPGRGRLSGSAPNLTYTPDANINGSDSFTFKVNNGLVDSNSATVTINVNPVNDVPVLAVPGAQTVTAGQPLSFAVTASDVDTGQVVTLSATNLPTGATFTQTSATSGQFGWTPSAAQTGNYTITFRAIDNGSPALSDSKTVSVTVTAPANPSPAITTLNPISANAGGAAFTLTVNGSNFVNGSIVRWNGSNRSTTFVSGTQVTAQIPASDIASAGTSSVTVFNPAPGGGTSNTVNFTISCSYAIQPTGQSFGADGGNGSVAVTAASDCGWTATSNASWLTITSGASGSGNGTVVFSVLANAGVARSGTLTIAGQTFMITQDCTGTSITAQPSNQASCTGGTALFGVTATGANLTYQWRRGGVNIPGATGNSLTIAAVTVSDAGSYDVLVTGSCGTTTSNTATLTVNTPPSMTIQPSNQNVAPGATVNFTAIASGSPAPTVQWQVSADGVNFTNVGGATSTTLTVANVTLAQNSNRYRAFFTNSCGTSASTAATLTVVCPTITVNPASLLNGTTGTAYSQTFSASGGVASYSFSVQSGTLPSGLALSIGGVLSGTPVVAGTSNFTIQATNANGCGGTRSYTVNIQASVSCPTITSFNPASGAVGSTVTITGANFTGVTAVRFASNVLAQFTINSTSQITTTVPNGAITGPVTLSKADCADVQTGTFTVTQPNPAPTIISLNPNSAVAGDFGFILTVNGSNFVNGSVVRWNGNNRLTTFVSGTQLTAQIPASDLTTAGTASVTVFNPAPGGGVSSVLSFIVLANELRWRQTSGLTGGVIRAFAVSETNLFTGTSGGGVFRSTDNGTSWMQVNNGLTATSIYALTVSGTSVFAGTFGGVFRSTDNGASWTQVNNGLTNTSVQDLVVNGGSLFAGTFGGVFRSIDNGASWMQVNNGLTSTWVNTLTVNGTTLFAGTFDGRGVFRSTDNGASWTQVNNGLTNTFVNTFTANGTTLLAGTLGGVFRSTDNGTSWTQVNNGLTDTNVYALMGSGTVLFAGTSGGGVFRSTDNGTSWSQVNNELTDTSVFALLVNGTSLFAGTRDGVYRLSDIATNWMQINNGLTATIVHALTVSGTSLFAGISGGIFRSTDNGMNWTQTNNSLTDTSVRALVVSGTDLFAGTFGGVFRSTDNGATWTRINNGLTDTDVYALAVSGMSLFAGTPGGGVFRSTNNGATWTRVNNGLTDTDVYVLTVSGTVLFAGTRGGGVYRSIDNGTSWTQVNNGLTATSVQALTVSGTGLFAGTFAGVYRSIDNGTSWTRVSNGLTDTNVYALTVSGTSLFAGTLGGVFRSTDNGTSWTQINNGLGNTSISSLTVSGMRLLAGTSGSGVFVLNLSGNP